MVLADLGRKLQGVLSILQSSPTLNDVIIDSLLKQVCAALMESDVNVKLVFSLRATIKKSIDQKLSLLSVQNQKKFIQKQIFAALCNLVDPGTPQWKPKKNHQNIVMFVGLQGNLKIFSSFIHSFTKLVSYF